GGRSSGATAWRCSSTIPTACAWSCSSGARPRHEIPQQERRGIMSRFDGKTALVTGGNSGIGLATALAFAREGARVVITGRDQATLDQAKARLGAGALAIRNDAGRVADAVGLADTLGRQSIRLDAVFINAGVVRLAPLDAVEEQAWDETFNTNVKGPYFLLKALTPLLNSGGAVVLNGSINAHIGMLGSSVYAASKAALIS